MFSPATWKGVPREKAQEPVSMSMSIFAEFLGNGEIKKIVLHVEVCIFLTNKQKFFFPALSYMNTNNDNNWYTAKVLAIMILKNPTIQPKRDIKEICRKWEIVSRVNNLLQGVNPRNIWGDHKAFNVINKTRMVEWIITDLETWFFLSNMQILD